MLLSVNSLKHSFLTCLQKSAVQSAKKKNLFLFICFNLYSLGITALVMLPNYQESLSALFKFQFSDTPSTVSFFFFFWFCLEKSSTAIVQMTESFYQCSMFLANFCSSMLSSSWSQNYVINLISINYHGERLADAISHKRYTHI